MKKIIGFYRKCDLLTMCGMISAFIGIIMLLNEHYTFSILFLMISGLCDAFDGTLARKGKYNEVQKVYGAQLDSISDVICFGTFPSIITVIISQTVLSYIAGIFHLLCGAIRLAYFNTLDVTKTGKKGVFVGIPITTVSIVMPIIFIITKIINFEYLKITLPITLFLLGLSYIIGFEYKKPNVPAIFNKIFNEYVVNLVLFPMFLIIGSDIIFKLNFCKVINVFTLEFDTIAHYFMPFLLCYLLVLIIYLIFICITGKPKSSNIIMITIFALLILINDIKFNIMGNPIELSDVNYLNPDNISMMKTATGSIGTWIIGSIIKVLIFVLLSLIALLRSIKIPSFKIKKRVISLLLSILFFIAIVFGLKSFNSFVIRKVYKLSDDKLNSFTLNSNMYYEVGYYPGLILNSISKIEKIPEGYDRKEVISLLKSYENKEKNLWDKANVVFILSEAFSDLRNISGVTFDKDLMPNITSYLDDSDKMVFDFIAPTYGGASVNTEFEVLTGASINFFATGYIPYTQYYNDVNGKYAPNIIKEFNNNGYETMYLTPWGKNSYKSEYVYSLFGVDKKVYGDKIKGSSKGYYYSDESLMNSIFEELKDTSEGNYKFIMAASAQNHYPYNKDKYKKYDVNIVKSDLSVEDKNIILNYAQGIYDADKELNNLYKMIQTIDTPTIVVFYGDHLPYTIDTVGNDPYLGDSYFNTSDESLNLFRKYTTKAVILSNYKIKTEKIDNMNASYLGAYVINNMDLKISNYFKYIADLSNKIPAFNRTTIDVNGELKKYSDSKEENDLLNTYKYVQYNALYEYGH